MTDTAYIIEADNLCKKYNGQRVVDTISLQICRGECFGLLGPNGAGKTTTLRMMLGLSEPVCRKQIQTRGVMEQHGVDVTGKTSLYYCLYFLMRVGSKNQAHQFPIERRGMM